MVSDAVSSVCKEDNLILNFGVFFFEKYHTTQSEFIRQSMRQLAKLVMELKNADTRIKNLSDALAPDKFDSIIKAPKTYM
ncbi:hypothetical protein NQ314_015432 [Rhamnusium bicolor]|uniref:Uncharacterized protein n=1 Tax=Rhamnusium bicolor TaxID=1586634 RepID=A0AAV8WYY5_9CUCU|nr:hypothetical protein NQ314_015432 [Rhamnusium bicolor]